MFRPLTITAVLNGWIVQCGCQTVVYQERNQLVSDLDAYLKDPVATEERFLKSSVNRALTADGRPVGADCAPTPMRELVNHRRDVDRDTRAYAASETMTTGRG